MVVNGGVGATSGSIPAEAEVGDRVQGGLMDGRGGVEEGVGRGGRPCWVRTML
jgi:hypothetical protein